MPMLLILTKDGSPISCFKCGGNHRLSNCPVATKEEIKRLYDQKLTQRQRNPPRQNSQQNQPYRKQLPSGQSRQHGKAADGKSTANQDQQSQQPARQDAKQATLKSSPNVKWATVAKAKMARAFVCQPAEEQEASYHSVFGNACMQAFSKAKSVWSKHVDKQATRQAEHAHHVLAQSGDLCAYSEITDWLVDSGCSISMTPFLEDLVSDVTKAAAVVEVATGVLTQAPLQGTVKIHIQDIYTHDECYVLLEDVLYVPGLSKRLLSVRQWNTTGGDVLFDIDHCILSIMDSATNEKFDMAVKPPYADSDEELHSPNANSASDAVLPTDDVFKTRDIGDAYFASPIGILCWLSCFC